MWLNSTSTTTTLYIVYYFILLLYTTNSDVSSLSIYGIFALYTLQMDELIVHVPKINVNKSTFMKLVYQLSLECDIRCRRHSAITLSLYYTTRILKFKSLLYILLKYCIRQWQQCIQSCVCIRFLHEILKYEMLVNRFCSYLAKQFSISLLE